LALILQNISINFKNYYRYQVQVAKASHDVVCVKASLKKKLFFAVGVK
jgi:hypothetical protein